MRFLRVFIVIIFIGLAVMLFTRPSNEFLREKATQALLNHKQTTPGYENPLEPTQTTSPTIDSTDIIIENRIFWKSVGYAGPNGFEKLGYGLFNRFYDVSEKKNNTQ